MHVPRAILAVLVGLVASFTGSANANIIWNWSFDTESGQFVTDGTTPVAGTYTMVDFSVTATGAGGTLGSLSGGQYVTDGFATDQPFSFVWDGSQVTQWLHSSMDFPGNPFEWWAFDDTVIVTPPPGQAYFFAWNTFNDNDPTHAALWNGDDANPLSVGIVTVSFAQQVPEPSTLALLGLALVALRFRRGKATDRT